MNHTKIPNMVTIVPEGKKGRAAVSHFTVTDEISKKSQDAGGLWRVDVGKYAVLRIDGDIVMSDTKMERESNQDIIDRAHGDVLIAGLGIGMLPAAMLTKKEVTSITVIDDSEDVIDLVAPHIKKLAAESGSGYRFNAHKADAFKLASFMTINWTMKYDVIYFDIWSTIEGNAEEMLILRNLYDQWLNKDNPNHFIGSWMEVRTVEQLLVDRKQVPGLRDVLENLFDDTNDLDVNLER